MMNTKSLVVIGASLFSLSGFAEVCTSQLVNNYGSIIREFNLPGFDSREACKEAMKSCRITLRQMQRRGQISGGDCVSLGVTGGGSTGGGYEDPVDSDDPVYGDYQYELDRLRSMLNNNAWRTREHAARELTQYPSLRALKMAIKATKDSDSDVRNAAKNSANNLMNSVLTAVDPVEAVQALEPLTKKSQWRVRHLTAKALKKTQSAHGLLLLIDMSNDSDSDVRNMAEGGVTSLLNAVDLRRVVRSNTSEFVQILKNSSSWKERFLVVKVLKKAKLKKTVAALVKAVGDSDSDVKSLAESAVKQVISTRNYTNLSMNMINKLENVYRSSSSWKVRQMAIKALGATLNYAVRNTLFDALNDSDIDVRNAAQAELRKF